MRRTKTTNILHGIAMSGFLLVLSLLFQTHATHAASITIATGTDEETVNSNCSLSEAITNINNGDATSYPECTNTSSDAYGTNDTIHIPEGVVTLVGDTPGITKPLHLVGAGSNLSTVSGGGTSRIFGTAGDGDVSVSKIKMTAFNQAAIFFTNTGHYSFSHIEIDGADSTSNTPAFGALAVIGTGNVSIDNVYIHGVHATPQDLGANGIILGTAGGGVLTTSITDTTIEDITSQTGGANGLTLITGLVSDLSPGTLHTTVSNTTITNIHSYGEAPAAGISSFAAINGGDTLIDFTVNNSTITGIHSKNVDQGAAVSVGGLALQESDTATTNAVFSNLLVADSYANDVSANCKIFDGNAIFGEASGSVATSITSSGGNITDDTTCNSYFTQPTDKNNITTLKDFLGPISNNGGYVPTIPLLAGSPAIDNGITVSDLTTDARGVTRPQGQAYDSGAYEYVPTANLAGTGENVKLFLFAAVGLVVASGVVLIIRSRQK